MKNQRTLTGEWRGHFTDYSGDTPPFNVTLIQCGIMLTGSADERITCKKGAVSYASLMTGKVQENGGVVFTTRRADKKTFIHRGSVSPDKKYLTGRWHNANNPKDKGRFKLVRHDDDEEPPALGIEKSKDEPVMA